MALDAVRKCESYIQCKILSLCHKESELYFEDLAQIIRGVTPSRLPRDTLAIVYPATCQDHYFFDLTHL